MARTKNRGAAWAEKPPNKTWRAAFYIRLSREDGKGMAESESIANQRLILSDFLAQQDDGDEYVFAGEFIDDGVSGTTDGERPGFQRLLRSIEAGEANCVIVKNLSRSFRNYADQGYYLDEWFPRRGVRFISLYQQTIDSYKDPAGARSIAVPVQGVLNEEHAKSTSESVRRVFDKKREKGLHIGSFAPYGYVKNPKDKNALIIDLEAAETVRQIFSLFLAGRSQNAIVRLLNDDAIPCPSYYKRMQGAKYQNPNAADSPLWCAATVSGILKNRIYRGDMVQGRHRIKSYKLHMQETVPKNEWYVVKNTHEAIIDKETFESAQRLLMRDTRTAPGQGELYLFSGFLRCADCGKAMKRSRVKSNVYYHCTTYKNQSKAACTKHTIRHDRLEAGVLHAIRQQIYIAACLPHIALCLEKAPPQKSQSARLEQLIAAKEKELSKVARYRQSIYQDWKDGEITSEEYRSMREDYHRQAEAYGAARQALISRRAALEDCPGAKNPFWDAFMRHENIESLTREILIELVDHIKVYENGAICIRLRCANEYKQVGSPV